MGSESDRSDLVRVFVSETSEGLTTLAEALRLAAESSPAPHTLQEQYIIANGEQIPVICINPKPAKLGGGFSASGG